MQLDRYCLILAVAMGLGFGGSAHAQQAPAPAPDSAAPSAEAPAAEAPAPGAAQKPAEGAQPAAEAQPAPGGDGNPAASEPHEVIRDTFGDWQVRCTPNGEECFLYQLARDSNKNPVAEISMVKLPKGGEAVSGMTVVTPLGTLLTAGIGLQIDTSDMRQYPFSWCNQLGCFARFGLTDQSIAAMKRGKAGKLMLVSVSAPDHPVTLALSLTGFTAAYDSIEAPNLPAAPAPAPAAPATPPAAANPAPLALPAK